MLLATCMNTPIDHNVFHNLHARVARCSASCVNGALRWCERVNAHPTEFCEGLPEFSIAVKPTKCSWTVAEIGNSGALVLPLRKKKLRGGGLTWFDQPFHTKPLAGFFSCKWKFQPLIWQWFLCEYARRNQFERFARSCVKMTRVSVKLSVSCKTLFLRWLQTSIAAICNADFSPPSFPQMFLRKKIWRKIFSFVRFLFSIPDSSFQLRGFTLLSYVRVICLQVQRIWPL